MLDYLDGVLSDVINLNIGEGGAIEKREGDSPIGNGGGGLVHFRLN
jgi:hypothetical protein